MTSAINYTVPSMVQGLEPYLYPCLGRLSLLSGDPHPVADQLAKTTVYFGPYRGNTIALFGGTFWRLYDFSEVSVAVPSTTVTPFDLFGVVSASQIALETLNWTNDSTRATALTTQNGVLVKSGDPTRRYLGTGRTTGSSGQCEDSAAKRFLVNWYNPIPRRLYTCPGYTDNDSTTSYDHANTSWAEANAGTGSKVEYLIPYAGWPVRISLSATGDPANGQQIAVGIGFDSTTNATAAAVSGTTQRLSGGSVTRTLLQAAGYHYADLLALVTGGTGTLHADINRLGGTADPAVTFLDGEILG